MGTTEISLSIQARIYGGIYYGAARDVVKSIELVEHHEMAHKYFPIQIIKVGL